MPTGKLSQAYSVKTLHLKGLAVLADIDSPGAKRIIMASRYLGRLRQIVREMTVAPSFVRQELLREARTLLHGLHALKEEIIRIPERPHQPPAGYTPQEFTLPTPLPRDTRIQHALTEFEAGIVAISELGNGRVFEDRRDGKGACPICNSPISKHFFLPRLPKFVELLLRPNYGPSIILCHPCSQLVEPALTELEEGFDIMCI